MQKNDQIKISYSPDVLPPLNLMKTEGIDVLEEWFRWAEEWSMILKIYGKLKSHSSILEIGCGLGRIAFPLRFILFNGKYEGFDICKYKIEFLQESFQKSFKNFSFKWADINNTFYNPNGQIKGEEFNFPYEASSFDLVFAASVFTHMLPNCLINYFLQTASVLKIGAKCLFSFFLLDHYEKSRPRPLGFSRPAFNFDYNIPNFGNNFAVSNPDNPELMTAYRLNYLLEISKKAGLELIGSPIPGMWSGISENWVGSQDLLIFQRI